MVSIMSWEEPDPEGEGAPPNRLVLVPIRDAFQYTHVDQFDFFRDWINFHAAFNTVVTFNEEDGTISWWGGSYRLPLGAWLADGRFLYTTEQLLATAQRPVNHEWPESIGIEPTPYPPVPEPEPEPDPTPEEPPTSPEPDNG